MDSENNNGDLNPAGEMSAEQPQRPNDSGDDFQEQGVADPPRDKVGYKRPPMHTRFKPGQSGNPKGRPRGAGNLRTYVLKELKEKVGLKGTNRRISKGEALVKKTFAKALGGDARATDQVIKLLEKIGHLDVTDSGGEQIHSADDEQALEILKDQMRQQLASEQTANLGQEGATGPEEAQS